METFNEYTSPDQVCKSRIVDFESFLTDPPENRAYSSEH